MTDITDFDFDSLVIHEEPKAEIVDPLNLAEYHELETLEETIEAGLTTFIQVGNALAEIRDKRLYREDFATFEAYCQERWDMGRRHANHMIAGAAVVENLGTIVPKTDLPQNEAQVRPLTKLEPENQSPAWLEASETAPGGKVTGAHVQRVVERYMPKPEADVAREVKAGNSSPSSSSPSVAVQGATPVSSIPPLNIPEPKDYGKRRADMQKPVVEKYVRIATPQTDGFVSGQFPEEEEKEEPERESAPVLSGSMKQPDQKTKPDSVATYLEDKIYQDIQPFLNVNRWLRRIKDESLYLETHETFEEYCQHRFGIVNYIPFREEFDPE